MVLVETLHTNNSNISHFEACFVCNYSSAVDYLVKPHGTITLQIFN